ncbi:MAG: hypothetical protein PHU85_19600, partial [Phycisphaerae bacterium]|nr:hypothetical protein [Phycisphaerae bacterium]
MSHHAPTLVIHLVDRDSPPIAAAAIGLLRSRLDPLRWRHRVVALAAGPHADWLTRERIPFEAVPLRGRSEPLRSLALGRWLGRLAPGTYGSGLGQEKGSDAILVHAHSPRAASCAAVAAVPRRALRAAPVLAELYRQPEDRPIRWLAKASARLDLRLAARSAAVASFATAAGFDPSRVAIVPPAVDPARLIGVDRQAIRHDLGLTAANSPVLLASGWCHRRDDQKLALWAAAILSMLHPDLRIIVPGDGPDLGTLSRWISQAGFGHIAILPGRRLAWPQLLSVADVLIHAGSKGLDGCGGFESETTPIAWAALAGVPVVAAELAGVTELVRD